MSVETVIQSSDQSLTVASWPLWELINPSDPYTFRAPNVEIAGTVAALLSTSFGAKRIGSDERTPVLFGWREWLADRDIDNQWMDEHAAEISAAFDSFLIGGPNQRADVESMLALLPPEKRQGWRADRQNRHRTSLSQIGETAYTYAKQFAKIARERTVVVEPAGSVTTL